MLRCANACRERARRETGAVEGAARIEIAGRQADGGAHIAQEVEEVRGVVGGHLVGAVEGADDRLERAAIVIETNVLVEGAEFRSEEHTSELQSLMRISYAVFCLKKK